MTYRVVIEHELYSLQLDELPYRAVTHTEVAEQL